MEEMSSYHSIPTDSQIFVQASKIATDFFHCLTRWLSSFIFLKPKYDLMKDQRYKLCICLARSVMGETVHCSDNLKWQVIR